MRCNSELKLLLKVQEFDQIQLSKQTMNSKLLPTVLALVSNSEAASLPGQTEADYISMLAQRGGGMGGAGFGM